MLGAERQPRGVRYERRLRRLFGGHRMEQEKRGIILQCNFQPYEGEKPFIFVSYSHKDGGRIAPILNWLNEKGFRIWYDEGIDWGTKWPEVIARHLRLCRACLVFHSASSVESIYCQREILTATNLNKQILPVYLEDVKLTEGIEFLLTMTQAIHYWQYRNFDGFCKKLIKAPALRSCAEDPALPPAEEEHKNPPETREVHQEQREKRGNYTYFCPGCGGEMDANNVLFDMSEIFFGAHSGETRVLRLGMTEMELRAIRRSGEWRSEGEKEYVLALAEILSFAANPRNLNDPDIAGLSMEELEQFLSWESPVEQAQPEEQTQPGLLPEFPWAIRAMIARAPGCFGEKEAARQLRKELQALREGLDQNRDFHFTVELRHEEDDRGAPVLTGMIFGSRFGARYLRHNRICPRCGRPVFEHAGTAEQKQVVFLGAGHSAQAGIVTALTHYAANHMAYGMTSDPIWGQTMCISEVMDVHAVDISQDLREDMARYERGLPVKSTRTDSVRGCYAATLRLRSAATKKSRFLTLMTLPGEMEAWSDGLREDSLRYQLPGLVRCDALVVCVEGQDALPVPEWLERLRNVFNQAELYQNLLVKSGAMGYAPTMLLHINCRELENGRWSKSAAYVTDQFQQLYMLERERQDMRKYPRYQMASRLFANTGRLNQTFRAELRCSAYGPDRQGTDGAVKPPRPVHIALLMKWLLMVTGCIEIRRIRQVNGRTIRKLSSYTLVRGQHRSQNPVVERGISAEAFARCALFSNPGVHDRQRVEIGDHMVQNWIYNLRIPPDSNAVE